MTITSLPKDFDNLVQKDGSISGQDSFVATKTLFTFFEDIVNELESLRSNNTNASLAISNAATVKIASLKTILESAKKEINQSYNELQCLNVKLAFMQAVQSDFSKRLSNVEQTSWR